jgi:hypothetical protein
MAQQGLPVVPDLLQPYSLPLWQSRSRRSGAARGVSTAQGRWRARPASSGVRRNSTPELDPVVVSAGEPPTPRPGRRRWADILAYGPPGQLNASGPPVSPWPCTRGSHRRRNSVGREGEQDPARTGRGHCGCCRRGGHALPCCALSGHHARVRARSRSSDHASSRRTCCATTTPSRS